MNLCQKCGDSALDWEDDREWDGEIVRDGEKNEKEKEKASEWKIARNQSRAKEKEHPTCKRGQANMSMCENEYVTIKYATHNGQYDSHFISSSKPRSLLFCMKTVLSK